MNRVRIAHLSDPHFGTQLPGVEEALLRSLTLLNPQLVLISGDITQRARRTQFQAAAQFIEKLKPLPSFAVPGNHDIPLFNLLGRFFSPYAGFHQHFQALREKEIQVGPVQVFGLNSTSRWRHIQGNLDEARVKKAIFKTNPETQVKVVVVHHPLDCDKRVDEKNLLKQRHRTMELFQKAQIDLVLSGHIHDPYVGLSKVRYPSLSRSMVLSVAGTCLSWRTRKDAPNSFHVIDIEPNTISIARYDLNSEMEFAPLPEKRFFFRRGDRGWIQQ